MVGLTGNKLQLAGSTWRNTSIRSPAIRILLAAALLCASSSTMAGDRTADFGGHTLIVGLDDDAYRLRGLYLLADQVEEAAESQSDRIDTALTDGGVVVTIRDLPRDKMIADFIETQFANRPDIKIAITPGISMWIGYSAEATKAYGEERLQRGYSTLEAYVENLRDPLPGLVIEHRSDGAVVHANDSSFVDIIREKFGGGLVVTAITATSWHVSWNATLLPRDWSLAKKLEAEAETDKILRQALGSPLELPTYRYGDGIGFTVRNPDRHGQFIKAVRDVFSNSRDFTFRETPSLVLNFSLDKSATDAADQQKQTVDLPPRAQLNVMNELEESTNPPVQIQIEGNAVSLRARDPSHNADRAAIVREALSGRNDLVVSTQPDHSLLITAAPAARIGPPVPELRLGELLDAVKSRSNSLKLRPLRIAALGAERVRIWFASAQNAKTFQNALSKPSGISIRLVDATAPDATVITPPSIGDEIFKLPTGEEIWVKPAVIVSGEMIADASVGINAFTKDATIEFRLTDEGRDRLATATRQHVGQRFVIVLGSRALEAPVIEDPITAGKGEIGGGFTSASAAALVQSILAHRTDLPLRIIQGAE